VGHRLEHQRRHAALRGDHADRRSAVEERELLMSTLRTRRRPGRGFSLIEILISLVITAFGLLGLAAFASRATAMGVEATQRARAAALLGDMAGRLANRKLDAAAFVTGAVQGAAIQDCTGLAAGPALDLCEWNNLLAGANDAHAGGNAAGLGFRGCVTQPVALDPVFVVTVAWGSLDPGIPPADGCAANAFGDESLRRVLRAQVRVATLTL
jgi:type IV pilus assembly protein PilV